MVIRTGQPFEANEHLGLAGCSDSTASLLLSTTYQDLVTAPSIGLRKVNQIILTNEDASVSTDFFFKLVRSGVDYTPIQINLSPSERFLLEFPWILKTTDMIQSKVAATCVGHANASYIPFFGGNGVANFTGTTWTDMLTAAGAIDIGGVAIVNTDASTQTISIREINASSTVLWVLSKTMPPLSTWFIDPKINLPTGYKLQVKHGAALKTGSAFVSYFDL